MQSVFCFMNNKIMDVYETSDKRLMRFLEIISLQILHKDAIKLVETEEILYKDS